MTEADACRRNFTLNHQSDIFNQKDLTSKEFQYSQKAHNPNVSNKTSCNFMTWEDSKNFNNTISSLPNYSRKKRIFCSRQIAKPKNFEEKLYRVDDLPKKTFNYLGQRETLFMGDYEGNEYKIKKAKTNEYNPNLYFKMKKPNQVKLEQIYGHISQRKKPAIQRTKTEEKRYNTLSNDPREMKYINIYGRKKIENQNKQLESLSYHNSTNNVYNPKLDPKQNRVNMLKSNIFNDSKIEKMNTESNFIKNNDLIRVRIKEKKDNKFGKKAKFDNNAEKLPSNLDWKDAKTNLLFNSEKDKEAIKKDARQRKFNEIYGTEPSKPKEKAENNFKQNDRNLIEQAIKKMYNDLNPTKIKKISENVSQIQGNQFVDKSSKYKEKNNQNNEVISYEINCNRIHEKEIEKAFANKGLHIYDIKEGPTSVIGNIKDNKIVFKVRENKDDKEFDKKIKEIKKEFKNNKKVDIKTAVQPKKKNVDLLPSSLRWNNVNSFLYTKNRDIDKTLQEKTHSKPIENNNNEQKVTKIFVNVKYKNKNNFNKF